MELYFKDLEAEVGDSEVSFDCAADDAADQQSDDAEDVAFAELAERVCAARLVY